MSADGAQLEWRFGSVNIILKVHHPRTIHAIFALNWLTGFWRKLQIIVQSVTTTQTMTMQDDRVIHMCRPCDAGKTKMGKNLK